MRDVVVVGASLAGLRAAETVRNEGFDGTVTLVGAEPHLPYDRPPLSKKLLAGELEPERIRLRKDHEYAELGVTLRLGTRATALDLDRRRLTLDDGDNLAYDGLVIATGATPRRLPTQPEHLEGLFELRTLDDALALRAALEAGPERVVVVGAGFIGSEVAATARQRGLDVTILEALPVPLERALGPSMGMACAALHADHGVEVRLSTGVVGFAGTDRIEGVHLSDGTTLEADVVVVGIGVVPNTAWLQTSGLELHDGVVCDATLAARDAEDVFAAGDAAAWPHPMADGGTIRIEHWTNAAEQGAAAARNLLAPAAERTPYEAVPYFWSDQKYGTAS
jgi:NADPH-dependent 2,4-dienoyl-CoA reductase/sulfur reductase-like enzyme